MKNGESQLQQACVTWFRLQYPKLSKLLFAVPNGGKREQVTVETRRGYRTFSPQANRLKEEGVVPGVSDLILLIPKKGYASLCIEMKFGKNSQSDNQKEWQRLSEAAGNKYVVCRTLDEFVNVVKRYLTNR